MFSLREFVKKGFLSAIGKMEDYQIILKSADWHEKGVLEASDLEEINSAIAAQDVEPEVPKTFYEETLEKLEAAEKTE